MSAQATQAEIESVEIEEKTQNRIETRLADYRHVTLVEFDRHLVKVHIESECTYYDSDAIIGLMVRKFDLEYTGEHQGKLHFGSWEEAE